MSKKVIQYANLSEATIEYIINKYGKYIAPNLALKDFQSWGRALTNKRYCILIFLEEAVKIEPFNINKAGFGISSAWLVVENIDKVKVW